MLSALLSYLPLYCNVLVPGGKQRPPLFVFCLLFNPLLMYHDLDSNLLIYLKLWLIHTLLLVIL